MAKPWPIEIVDLPNSKVLIFHSYVNVYQVPILAHSHLPNVQQFFIWVVVQALLRSQTWIQSTLHTELALFKSKNQDSSHTSTQSKYVKPMRSLFKAVYCYVYR